jgi:epoxyqueuosine reductase QueG
MDETAFNREFDGTPIRRANHAGMKRNAQIAAGNLKKAPAI